jgi:hypothetical protein
MNFARFAFRRFWVCSKWYYASLIVGTNAVLIVILLTRWLFRSSEAAKFCDVIISYLIIK